MNFKVDEFLSDYLPYLIGIRAVDGYKIIDVKIPSSWKFGTPIEEVRKNFKKVQTLIAEQTKEFRVISLVGDDKFQNYDTLFAHLSTIIKVNREREEKNRLFKEKVKQLEEIFINSELDTLNHLSFDIRDPESELSEEDTEIELKDPEDQKIDDSDVMNSLNTKIDAINKKPPVQEPPRQQSQEEVDVKKTDNRELTVEEILQAERIAEAQEKEDLED